VSHGWDAALDAQTALVHSYRTLRGQEYMSDFVKQLLEAPRWDDDTERMIPRSDDRERPIEALTSQLQGVMAHTEQGDPVWVSSDVLDLVEVAAESFEPEPIYSDDVFIPGGFCLFERPLRFTDSYGRKTAYRAVQWGPFTQRRLDDDNGPTGVHREGLMLALFGHREDPDDHWSNDERPMPLIGGSPLALNHMVPVVLGDDLGSEPAFHRMMKHIQVLWRLAQQEITVPGRERVSRPTWKRAASWRQIKEVVVLRLRRAHARDYEGDERDVEWSHRWMVSGHWRNQPYKINGETVHRQIWIAPYVKGPESKPLVIKKRAVEFVR
jgi:hypothetical protein